MYILTYWVIQKILPAINTYPFNFRNGSKYMYILWILFICWMAVTRYKIHSVPSSSRLTFKNRNQEYMQIIYVLIIASIIISSHLDVQLLNLLNYMYYKYTRKRRHSYICMYSCKIKLAYRNFLWIYFPLCCCRQYWDIFYIT